MTTKTLTYAKGTQVSIAQSQADIKTLLQRFGAKSFATMEDEKRIGIAFVLDLGEKGQRRVLYSVDLPEVSSMTPQARNGVTVGKSIATLTKTRYETEIARIWRTLFLGIKGKLVMVEEGIETVDQAFFANILVGNAGTVYNEVDPTLTEVYRTGNQQPLLPTGRAIIGVLPSYKAIED